METVTDFIYLGSKITADGDCSHEIKRRLLFGRESCDQPRQHIEKQRQYFASKGPSTKSCGFFPVVMYGCESWAVRKLSAEELMLLNCGVGEDS